uniref:Reverse transcriptase zinc-binding domain-containing protein n=1 Tax=Fagus sylvatica TaxID=28930 RepID=A0A2N9HU94_FAGSY
MAPDGLRWKCRKAGVFDSRSFYEVLNDRPGVVFPWKSIWKAKAPPRVAFFIWSMAWGKILTSDNLMHRGTLEFCLLSFQYPVGHSEVSAGTIIWMVELVWKASFQH